MRKSGAESGKSGRNFISRTISVCLISRLSGWLLALLSRRRRGPPARRGRQVDLVMVGEVLAEVRAHREAEDFTDQWYRS